MTSSFHHCMPDLKSHGTPLKYCGFSSRYWPMVEACKVDYISMLTMLEWGRPEICRFEQKVDRKRI